MANSWRSYGGVNSLDKFSNLKTNTISVDNFILRQAYSGNFDISGQLNVANNVTMGQDLAIGGNCSVAGDTTINKNMSIIGDAFLTNATVSNNLLVSGDINIINELYFGSSNSDLNSNYIGGNETGIGVNTLTPDATFDISGSNAAILNVYSTSTTNTNILARNRNKKGIVLSTSDTSSCIQFYNDQAISTNSYDAQIKYILGGNLQINASTTLINSKVSISKLSQNQHINNESAMIYDISAGPYLRHYYNQPTYNTGNALSLIADNSNSNTQMRIITPSNKGIVIGGGAFIGDSARSMGTIGLQSNNKYIPAQTIISGNATSNRATIGINKYNPITETYVLDINGPVHIDNGEITNSYQFPQQILCVGQQSGFCVAAGSFLSSYDLSGSTKYTYYIYYSNNAGKSWNQTLLLDADNKQNTNLQAGNFNFNSIFVYDASNAFLGGDNGFLFFTNNAGKNWTALSGLPGDKINTIYAVQLSNNVCRVYIEYISLPTTYCIYFDITNFNYVFDEFYILGYTKPNDNSISYTRIDTTYLIKKFVVHSIASIAKLFSINSNNTINCSSLCLSTTCDSTTTCDTTPNCDTLTPTITANMALNDIKQFGSDENGIIIVVGNGVVYYNSTNTVGFILVSIPTINLNSVYIFDLLRAVAVGKNTSNNKSAFYYTNDGAQSWNPVPQQIINCSGIATIFENTSNDFINILMSDINTFVITSVSTLDSSSNIYYCYLPNLFNHKYNTLMDLCGNMNVYGDIYVSNEYITGNVVIGQDASFNGNLVLGQDALFEGNLRLVQDASFGGNLTLAHDASFGCNLFLGKNAIIDGNVNIVQNLILSKEALFEGNLILNQDASFGGNLFLTHDASFNANVYIGDNLNITNLLTSKDIIAGNTLYTNNLTTPVTGPAEMNICYTSDPHKNINIGGANDTINIIGKLNITGTQINTTPIIFSTGLIQLQLQANLNLPSQSKNAGIQIRDTDISGGSADDFNNAQGFIQLSSDLTGYNFKSTIAKYEKNVNGNTVLGNDNVVNFNTNSMILPSSTNAYLPDPFNNAFAATGLNHRGLVTIQQLSPVNPYQTGRPEPANYIISSYGLDVSNIFLKDYSVSDDLTQTITTNVKIFGNTDISGNVTMRNMTESFGQTTGALQIYGGVSIGGNTNIGGNLYLNNTVNSTGLGTGALIVSGGTSILGNTYIGGILNVNSPIIVNKLSTAIHPNMMMDVSGNAIITRLGLNVSAIDNNATLAVSGNVILTSGFIQQF